MDNPIITPNKIQRLMHLAEDKSFQLTRRLQLNNDEQSISLAQSQTTFNKTGTNYESSSGLLDLERVEGFGESVIGNASLSKSTTFNPGEMTGRSTEATDKSVQASPGPTRVFEEYGRHSVALDSITNNMDKQTFEINDLMRHSIATNYSFHSKRDLTADEASLVIREAPLPVQHSTQMNFHDSALMSTTNNMSVGAYFKNRCPEFTRILGNVDSPDRPSAADVSTNIPLDITQNNINHIYKMDQSLDCVPVRQSRVDNNERVAEKSVFHIPSVQDTTQFAVKKLDYNTMNVPKAKLENNNVCNQEQQMNTPRGVKLTNQLMFAHKSIMSSSKATDTLLRNLQSSLRQTTDDTECSIENSISLSKIADYLGKQSNVSITDMLQLNNQLKPLHKKQPLTEIHVNMLEKEKNNQESFVTNLKDTKKGQTASSSGSVDTVLCVENLKINEEKKDVPTVIVTRDLSDTGENAKTHTRTRSNSPSSKSRSTLSTVHENIASYKSNDSPMRSSRGEASASHIPSPNLDYKELDKSVVWHEVLQQKRLKEEGLAKEQWAEIITTLGQGFVGVSFPVTVTVTTLTDSWLTAKFEFDKLPNDGQDLTIELPRLPLLLSPGRSEKFTIHITSNVEMNTNIPFTMYLKDASVEGDIEQKGNLAVNIIMPTIQALSCDGINLVSYPPIQENTSHTNYFVLISDSPVDLQLELAIVEGEGMFVIKSVQEIKKADVRKALTDNPQGAADDGQARQGKAKNKQLCRLSSGNAIKVTIAFNSPKLHDMEQASKTVIVKGSLHVNMIGINTTLKKVSLVGTVGTSNLVVQIPNSKLQLDNEPTTITLCNTGTIPGVWNVKFKSTSGNDKGFPFKVSSVRLEIRPGARKDLHLVYTGPPDTLNEGTIVLEDTSNGNKTTLEISGGVERLKTFPIKTNYNNMSWVRAERKELSLKNSTDKKIQIRCQILGEGFTIDLPGVETRGTYILSFGPCECRQLPIVFAPNSNTPHAAALHLVFDKNSDFSRKIKLHGCAVSGAARWSGLVTYGDTALVRAVAAAPVPLALYNRAASPAFVAARIHYNLQYRWVEPEARLEGGLTVMGGRARHAVTVRVPWARLQRRRASATALATVTLLTGPELTRRRILRILRDETTGRLDASPLPEHLKLLAEHFEGEDPALDNTLENFSETKASLNELFEDIQELTAQIELPQEFSDDNTILISDDTVIEHHTLCD